MPKHTSEIKSQKAALREKIKTQKASLSPTYLQEASRAIVDQVIAMPAFLKAKVVFCYVSMSGEVSTRILIQETLKAGKMVVIPTITRDARGRKIMKVSELLDFDQDLTPGELGILEPKPESIRIIDPMMVDFALIPGLAFDALNNRLGYGAGYYDGFIPTLRKNCPLVAVAFDFQIVKKVPTEETDLPVSMVITDKAPFAH